MNDEDPTPAMTAPPGGLLHGASLFLDLDGTLIEIAERPDAVVVGARTRGLLAELSARLDGRLAIVSGRSVEAVRALLGDAPCAIAGSHGLEIVWTDGRARTSSLPAGLAEAAAEMDRFAAGHPGVLVERKPFGAALHYRSAPAAGDACFKLAQSLVDAETMLQPGKMVIELRAAGADKGQAVLAMLDQAPMADGTPVFLGDDLTDEPAFAAAAARGGAGVLVGEPRETVARYRLAGVGDALDWLERACGALA